MGLAETRKLRKDFVNSYKDGDLKTALFHGKRLLDFYEENEQIRDSGQAEDTHNVAVVFDELGLYDKAIEHYRKAASLKRARFGESPSYADTLNNLAIVYSNLEQYKEALKTHKRVLDVREKKLGTEHIDYIHTLYNIGNTYEALQQYDNALESHGKALEMSYCCDNIEITDVADIHASMARCFDKKGNFKKAIFYYEFAVDLIEKKQGVHNLYYITNALSLASVCEKSGYISLAVEYCERVFEIRRKLFPEDHSDYVNSLCYLAELCTKDGQFDKALKLHKTVLDLIETQFGEQHYLYAEVLDCIALDFCGKKDFKKALEFGRGALELREKILPHEDVQITKSYMTLGEIADEMGDYEKALNYYERALYIREKSEEEIMGAVADTWYKIAQLFDRQGAYEAAAFLYELALRIRNTYFTVRNNTDICLMEFLAEARQKQDEYTSSVMICLELEKVAKLLYGKQHPMYAMALKHLGVAYQKSGDLAMAEKNLQEAMVIQREALDEDNPIFIKTLETFAEICFSRGDCLRAIELYKERNDVNFEETPQEQREAACTLLAIANCYLKLGQKEKAAVYLTEAESKIKRSRMMPNDKYKQLMEIYVNGKNGNFHITKPIRRRMRDGERRCLEETIAFLEQFYDKIDDEIENQIRKKAFIAFSLGEMYQRLGKKQETVHWYSLAEKESEPEYYIRACTRLSEAYLHFGEEEKAIRKLMNGKEYIAEYGDIHSWEYCQILGYIGDYFYKKEDKDLALSIYLSWNQLYKELCLPNSIFYDNRLEKICKVLTASDQKREAVEQYYVLAMSIRNREGETTKFAKLLLRIAMLHIDLGDTKDAETLLDRVLILAGRGGITTERFGKVCDKVGRLYNLVGLEQKAMEALKLSYNQSIQGEKCITKEGQQLLSELLWKNGDYKAYFSVKNQREME